MSMNQASPSGFEFPEHVRPDLRWNHSLGSFAAQLDDPFLAVGRLHRALTSFIRRTFRSSVPAGC
jgi:hypothetical protein